MNTQTRRYVFIDYENLLQVKFKKLEKVASRIFVFIEASQETVPLTLVRQAQRSGKNLRWIVAGNAGGSRLNYHIAFIMGKLHQKLERDVEFAVISNDPEFDPLINFINASGRNCLRVKRKKDESSVFRDLNIDLDPSSGFDDSFHLPSMKEETGDIPVLVEEELIARTAEETVKRLIRSGNRPEEISTLKNYILLHSQELSLHGNVDRIIQKLKDSNDIEILQGEVIYNF
jgi:hypothetical protein